MDDTSIAGFENRFLVGCLGKLWFLFHIRRRFFLFDAGMERNRSAQLGVKDEAALRASEGRALSNAVALEKQVAVAVESACGIFAMAIPPGRARRGQVPERIYLSCRRRGQSRPFAKGRHDIFSGAHAGFMIVIFQVCVDGRIEAVNVTEAESARFGWLTTNKIRYSQHAASYPATRWLPLIMSGSAARKSFQPKRIAGGKAEVLRSGGFNPANIGLKIWKSWKFVDDWKSDCSRLVQFERLAWIRQDVGSFAQPET